jgi:hypothetical protein
MPKYLLVARNTPDATQAWMKMSAQEVQAGIRKYQAWSERVRDQGKLKEGQKLRDAEGRVLRGHGQGLKVTDGPHSESKEVIGGFWILEASSYDEAVKLASDSPHLEHGSLELREIQDMSEHR